MLNSSSGNSCSARAKSCGRQRARGRKGGYGCVQRVEALEHRVRGIGDGHDVRRIEPVGNRRARGGDESHHRRAHRRELADHVGHIDAVERIAEPAQKRRKLSGDESARPSGSKKRCSSTKSLSTGTGHETR